MATQSKVASTRRKSKPNPKVVANVVYITPELRKEFAAYEWRTAVKEYVLSLSNHERNICKKLMLFVGEKPDDRVALDPCAVIPFPSIKVSQGAQA